LPVLLVACTTTEPAEPRVLSAKTVRASWYHEGRWNADGSRYHPDGVSAAHRSLPFGTRVRVTHTGNGRSVVVVVKDRGPARWTGKDIDLSRGAARSIGMIEQGVATVHLEVLGN
jgi:rare lipoprotein A